MCDIQNLGKGSFQKDIHNIKNVIIFSWWMW